ncbi:hypothetical protein N7508_001707 [Penicillium antarcticum]|uniref:uncharacterized protein n=1 Tax=Penicillium antarcticum TaxID=416450 RepID=UPI002395C747|nr:uncharacterized protein N7508_001707 [Penicillium antarcticum]KAJ5317199.1 hypothetical protein N7508_001707 [Penicillium antarcticum]
MPESPRYLNSRDRTEEAWEIVKRLHAVRNEPGAHESVTREFYQMRKQIELDRRFQTSYWGTLTTPSLHYGSVVWSSLGFDTLQVPGFQVGFQSIGLVTNALSMSWVDHRPRHWDIAFGLDTCAVLMAIEAALQRLSRLHKPLEEIAALFGGADQVVVYQRELIREGNYLEDIGMVLSQGGGH